jgi:alkylation response protein AidB-like acyl-CoA dehydrogenase
MAALSEEQSLLKDQVSAWVREQSPVVKFREMRDSGVEQAFAPAIWPTMVEMGWTGILVPEQYGGSDLGYLTFGVVLEGWSSTPWRRRLWSRSSASVCCSAVADAQKKNICRRSSDGSEIRRSPSTKARAVGPAHCRRRRRPAAMP